jgi:hypothetical protein
MLVGPGAYIRKLLSVAVSNLPKSETDYREMDLYLGKRTEKSFDLPEADNYVPGTVAS